METLLSFLVAFALTLFFVRRYVGGNRSSVPAGSDSASPAQKPCPRCGKPVPEQSAFCGNCGVPLELWKIHRSEIDEQGSEPAEGEKEARPRPVINLSLCIGCGTCVDVCPEEGTLALVDGKAVLADPGKCTGHARCKEVCPTSAISLAFGNVLQTVQVPLVNENFETNIPGLFIVGELGGMGLIKTAINEGRLVIDYIRDRIHKEGAGSEELSSGEESAVHSEPGHGPSETSTGRGGSVVDVVIVGAGPAGLSASLSALQYGLSYVTFDQGEVASTIRQYPRHKFLMAEPVSMPLYGNLYIADGTKEALLSVWENIIQNTGVQVSTKERVENVTLRDGIFTVQTSKSSYCSRYVVLAMGRRGTPRRLDVPGEEASKVAYRLIEAEGYEGNDILVVGGGDSAVEAALALSRDGRNQVTLSYRRETFSRLRERNLESLEQAEKDGRLRVLRRSTLEEIGPDTVKLSTTEGACELANEFVFILAGGVSPDAFLRQIGVQIVEKKVSA